MDTECKECRFWYADPMIDEFGFGDEYCHCIDQGKCALMPFSDIGDFDCDLPEEWK